jgi:16S rRNA (adenine1518-N6/adenine1519-N6)-dimethyltransferase
MILARKRFGQHFLEPAWIAKVMRVIAARPSDVFIEIGPGRGALTYPLAEAAGQVVAFEIDRGLAAALAVAQTGPADAAPLTVVERDFLAVTSADLRGAFGGHAIEAVRVAGNLPYNVAAPILFKLTALYRDGFPLRDATVMLQREVADRLLARPGSRDYGVLAILIGRHAHVERLLDLPPGAFRPMPAVNSTVVRLGFRRPDPTALNEATFEGLTRAIFTRRRKTLSNALLAFPGSIELAPSLALTAAAIDGHRRPESLTIEELVSLSNAYAPR